MDLKSDDRILLLAMPPLDTVRDIASRVADGLVVAIADREAIYDLRAAVKDLPHVMVVPADPEGAIPWKDEFFSVVYCASESEPTAEMLRVLLPGGSAIVSGGAVVKR